MSNVKRVVDFRRNRKAKLVELAGGRCVLCGYQGYSGAYDFHHVDPLTKNFNVSNGPSNTGSWDKVIKELEKCVLVCATCHREIHGGLHTLIDLKKHLLKITKPEKVLASKYYCECGKEIAKISKFCRDCRVLPTKIDWPPLEDLQYMIQNSNYTKVGEELGVSDNAIRKRIRSRVAKW